MGRSIRIGLATISSIQRSRSWGSSLQAELLGHVLAHPGDVPRLLPEGGQHLVELCGGGRCLEVSALLELDAGVGEDVLRGPALRAALVVPDREVGHAAERRGAIRNWLAATRPATGGWSDGRRRRTGVPRGSARADRAHRGPGARPMVGGPGRVPRRRRSTRASTTCAVDGVGAASRPPRPASPSSSPPARSCGTAVATSATPSSRDLTSGSSVGAGCTVGSTSTASRSATGSTSTASGRASPPR